MKCIYLLLSLSIILSFTSNAQNTATESSHDEAIATLIEDYRNARETKDAKLLESLLVEDIDQLVSSGTWRKGKDTALKGMLKSSQNNPGKRSMKLENFRLLNPDSGIADVRYTIQNEDGSERRMWSTFVVVLKSEGWKIAAIRNMLPASP